MNDYNSRNMAKCGSRTNQDTPLLSREDVVPAAHKMDDDTDPSEVSDESDSSEEQRKQIAVATKEEMRKLEAVIREKGLRYRLIDRIGEGTHSFLENQEGFMLTA